MSRDTPDNPYIITNTRPQVGDKTVSQDFTVVTHYCPAIHFIAQSDGQSIIVISAVEDRILLRFQNVPVQLLIN